MARRIIGSVTRSLSSSVNNNMGSLITEKMGHILKIGINRPDKRNCVDSNTAKLLTATIEDFENDDSLYAAVLYGTGGNFCAGFDLKELGEMDDQGSRLPSLPQMGQMGPTLRFIKKPMIAAISGYAVAGGLELALMCDLRVMEETAILGVYCRRFGVPLIDGGTVRLQSIVGLSRALDMILTGRSVTAREAFEWGIANRIVACGTALGQAINLASSLVKFPQECLRADRNSTYNAAFNSAQEELLRYEQGNGLNVIRSESIEGAKKFVSGIGRHGKTYNLKERDVKDWEREFHDVKSKL